MDWINDELARFRCPKCKAKAETFLRSAAAALSSLISEAVENRVINGMVITGIEDRFRQFSEELLSDFVDEPSTSPEAAAEPASLNGANEADKQREAAPVAAQEPEPEDPDPNEDAAEVESQESHSEDAKAEIEAAVESSVEEEEAEEEAEDK